MLLTDFYLLIDTVLEQAALAYTVTNAAMVIDDPPVSLFSIFFGFVVLEFFLVVLNSLRGQGYSGGVFADEEIRASQRKQAVRKMNHRWR